MVVSITSGAAGIAQPAHIHTGNCASLGSVKYPLTAIDGGKSVTLVNATLASVRNGGTAINVHKSAAEVSVYIACGDIPLAPSLAIAINESNSSGQKGIATLTAMGNKTQVVVDVAAAGLNNQPIHIHTGSCATLGGVKYPLANVFTGRSTTIVDVPFSSLRDGKFAVNAHKSVAEVSAYTACGDIPSLNGFAGSGTVASNIQGFRLESFTVKAGTKVTWTNKDGTAHTSTSSAATPVWDSGNLAKDAAFSYTFAQAGTFAYKCMTHPTTMLGIVTVEP